ncbi:carbon storage regulator CsrA [Paenibacillus sp. TRM 82003]|nr:carbon storage regulator CsrA [Paenibacillus sp. TRM 82003]MCI3923387.1 carbon storage regulator CsrA [Paenibacillus sp. TRM 82003]
MLVLTRKKGESIIIGDGIEVIILGSEGDAVKIGFKAPAHVGIYRKEIYEVVKESNSEAVRMKPDVLKINELMRKTDH